MISKRDVRATDREELLLGASVEATHAEDVMESGADGRRQSEQRHRAQRELSFSGIASAGGLLGRSSMAGGVRR